MTGDLCVFCAEETDPEDRYTEYDDGKPLYFCNRGCAFDMGIYLYALRQARMIEKREAGSIVVL